MRSRTQIERAGTERHPDHGRVEPDAPNKPFLAVALGVGLAILTFPAVAGIPMAPFLLGLVFLALLAPALVLTRRYEGRQAMRDLLRRVLVWRFGPMRWAIIVFAMPLLTIAVAAISGTLTMPQDGWSPEITSYLMGTLIIGALILNLWEETAWGGFLQTRLMAKHGLLRAAVMTAVPFSIIHIPLSFEGDWTWSTAGLGVATVFLAAPFYRYLLGMHLLDTGGSILAIGIQHASWNEAQKIDGVHGDWQVLVAVGLLTLLVALGRRLWRGSHPIGIEQEKAAASSWLILPRQGRPGVEKHKNPAAREG
jgi:membrane protease YdiL (CAAX protease family)